MFLSCKSECSVNQQHCPQLLKEIVKACKKQVKYDFAPYFGLSAKFTIVDGAGPIDWSKYAALVLTDETPIPSAFGFHDIQDSTGLNGSDIASDITSAPNLPDGTPFMIIEVQVCKDFSIPVDPTSTLTFENEVSLTVSHEILETLGDSAMNKWFEFTTPFTTNLYVCEVCDPVENVGYFISDTMVSDFVLPSYFVGPGQLGPYDFLNTLTGPFTTFNGTISTFFREVRDNSLKTRNAPNKADDRTTPINKDKKTPSILDFINNKAAKTEIRITN